MYYSSMRNYGCRFKEIVFHGCRSLIIENERISTLVLLGKGADIAEFVHKPSDTDVLWRSPGGYNLLDQPRTGREAYFGGWFTAFPNAGEPCSYSGAHIQRFGDARFLPFEYCVEKDTAEEVSLRVFCKTNCLPMLLERTMTLRSGESCLLMNERITNLSHIPLDYTMGHHPNISKPFLDEHCVLELPDCELTVLEADASGAVEPRCVGRYPLYTDAGKTVDVRKIPSFDCSDPELSMLYLRNFTGNRACVKNQQTGLSFFIEWDEKVFRGMLLCRAFVQQKWSDTFGFRYILVPFVLSSHHACLAEALRHGDALLLSPGETQNTWIRLGFE